MQSAYNLLNLVEMPTIHALNAISIDIWLHTQSPPSNSVGMLQLLAPLVPMKHHSVVERLLGVNRFVVVIIRFKLTVEKRRYVLDTVQNDQKKYQLTHHLQY
jgi:hypothetical protein